LKRFRQIFDKLLIRQSLRRISKPTEHSSIKILAGWLRLKFIKFNLRSSGIIRSSLLPTCRDLHIVPKHRQNITILRFAKHLYEPVRSLDATWQNA
jgi:hypothetical protein